MDHPCEVSSSKGPQDHKQPCSMSTVHSFT